MEPEPVTLVTPGQERRARRSGEAQGEVSSMQKHQAQARGVSHQRISQEVGGDHTAICARFCDLVWDYATHPRTDPAPILLEPMILYRQARAELSERDVVRSFHEKLGRQAEAQAEAEIEVRRWYRGEATLEALLKALRRDTWLRISALADGEYLLENGIDPREER